MTRTRKPRKVTPVKAWCIHDEDGCLVNHPYGGIHCFHRRGDAQLHCIFSRGMKPVRVLITPVPKSARKRK